MKPHHPQPSPVEDRGHSTNLVSVPTGLLASVAFNSFPVPLHITCVRETNKALFSMLDDTRTPEDAAELFQSYMAAVFDLDDQDRNGRGPARFHASSYLRLLRGWGYEANSPEGAVLKGWVESRFGLFPTFHKAPITRIGGPAWVAYIEEKMSSRFHSNAISTQLDLLYEFCQWRLRRFPSAGHQHVTLYRGTNDYRENLLVERLARHRIVVKLNSLVSFTSQRDIAETFGDIILAIDVPIVKILFFNALLPRHPLKGEDEYLVIGGNYEASSDYY
jgi:NAD+--dinitrogen-reductase ADP-D-ribosyltransferase